MQDSVEIADPFAIPDWWKISALTSPKGDKTEDIDYVLASIGKVTITSAVYPSNRPLSDSFGSDQCEALTPSGLDLRISAVPYTTLGPLKDVDLLEESTASSVTESFEACKPIDKDFWIEAAFVDRDVRSRSRTWATFQKPDISEQRTTFLSDHRSACYDRIIRNQDKDDLAILAPNAITCFVQLGLGRSSVLFKFDHTTHRFVLRQGAERILGHSLDISDSYVTALGQQGLNVLKLRNLVHSSITDARLSSLGSALLGEAKNLMTTKEASLISILGCSQSLLEVQNLFESFHRDMSFIMDVISRALATGSQIEMLSNIFESVRSTEQQAVISSQIVTRIWDAVAQPWLADMMTCIGLGQTNAYDQYSKPPAYIKLGRSTQDTDDAYGWDNANEESDDWIVPAFMSRADSRRAFDTGRAVRLLHTHQPAHPLLHRVQSYRDFIPPTSHLMTWSEVQAVANEAKSYERDAFASIFLHDRQPNFQTRSDVKEVISASCENTSDLQSDIQDFITFIEQPLQSIEAMALFPHDDETPLAQEASRGVNDFGPPFSMLPTLILEPWIMAQSRLVNASCLKMMFDNFNIFSHFWLLYRYYLFGDASFSVRLCEALFDPDMSSAERVKGVQRAGISGLRLGHRNKWPPASSELRLALMGILSDSYFASVKTQNASPFNTELPGGLSFAVRKISDEEIQKCMDPDSIYALDFLQLQYKAPPPLHVLITDRSVLKYDTIFKHLLKAKRMLFVVNRLNHLLSLGHPCYVLWSRLRIECRHFIHCVCNYFFDSIDTHWTSMTTRLTDLERSLRTRPGDGNETLSSLRLYHDAVLDDMIRALFLRKGQGQVLDLLDNIYEVVLQFAKTSCSLEEEGSQSTLKDLQITFNKKVDLFLRFCRNTNEKIDAGEMRTSHVTRFSTEAKPKQERNNTIGQLLLRLEMNGYYG